MSKHSRRIPVQEPAELPGDDRAQKRARKGGKAGSKKWPSLGIPYLPDPRHYEGYNFKAWDASWAKNA